MIEVDADTEHWAKVALQRMLDLPGKSTATDAVSRGVPQSAIQREMSCSIGRSSPTASRTWRSSRLSRLLGPGRANG